MSREEIHQELLWILISLVLSCQRYCPVIIFLSFPQYPELQCMFAPSPANFVFSLKTELPIFPCIPQRSHKPNTACDLFIAFLSHFAADEQIYICVWPCSGYSDHTQSAMYSCCRPWYSLVRTSIKLFRDSSGIVNKRLVHGVSQQMVAC